MSDIPPATPEDLALDLATDIDGLFEVAPRQITSGLVRLAAHWKAEAERLKAAAVAVGKIASLLRDDTPRDVLGLLNKLESLRREHLGRDEPPCDIYECNTCGILLCPEGSETHLWHDGCGICSICTWRGPDGKGCNKAWTTERTGDKLCNHHAAIVELAQEPLRGAEES